MSNINLFKALSSDTRQKILNHLIKSEMHISALSRKMKISKSVISRHVKILEHAGLIKKKIIGNVHLLSINFSKIEKTLEPFVEKSSITIEKNNTIFDALKQIPDIKVKKVGKHMFIQSINNEEGYFIYEVDGKPPNKPIDEYKIHNDIEMNLKKVSSINKKNIKIKIKK